MCIPGGRGEVPIAGVMHDAGRLRRVDGEALQGECFAGGHKVRGRDGRSENVKKATAGVIAATAALTGGVLAGCSVSTPAPAEPVKPTASPASTRNAGDASSPAAGGGTASQGAKATGTREACELFNKLVVDYAAVSPTDSKGYEDVYLKAQDAKDSVTGDLQGLFASLSLLAIDHSSAAESGGKPAQESQDAVRDAVFANSAACTAEGVTLRL